MPNHTASHSPAHAYAALAPAAGIALFAVLYVGAAALYPGGSDADHTAQRFSWLHNYWCNLLNAQALNGAPNPARPVALTAMGILCVSLAVFWYYLPGLLPTTSRGARLIRFTGIASMGVAFFLFTPYHDLAIDIAGVLGLIALLTAFVGLYRMRAKTLFWSGLVVVPLVVVNNAIYYTRAGISWLPLIQKISFCYVLGWICLLCVATYHQLRRSTGA